MPWLFLSTCETSAWPLPDRDAFGLPHCSQILVLVNPLQHLWKQFSPESLIPCVVGEEPRICVSHKLTGDGVATGPKMRSTGLRYSSTAPGQHPPVLGVVAGVIIILSLQVEFCKSFGDPTKPRAWSKHAQKSSQSKPPPKDKDAISTGAKKVRGRSLPAISWVSAERSPWEGREVGGRGIWESFLDGS